MNAEKTMITPASILILDDSPTTLAMTRHYLLEKGYHVCTASTQEEALKRLDTTDIDLLALDWELPAQDGLEFVRSLRSGWKYFDLPIILMTGHSESKDIISAMNAGCDDFVSKEDGVELLEVRIQRILLFLQRLEIEKPSRKVRHILLVDDSQTFLLTTKHYLEKSKFYISAVRSGKEALHLLDASIIKHDSSDQTKRCFEESIDLMVVDWMMPEMNGLELIRKVRENNFFKEIPIIMLSGKESLEDVTAAIEMGADDFINKEADLRLLEKKIGVLLRIQEQYHRYTHQIIKEKQKVESLVQQRTSELLQTNQKLKDTQAQLVHAEKMSSLGQLVAGVAHEINNPLSFIKNNFYTIQENIDLLQELLKQYRHYCQSLPQQKELEQIQGFEKEIGLEYTIQELKEFLVNSEEGAKRIQEIVLSLRNFSRLDEGEIKKVDLYEGIDSTLLILRHQLNDQIDVVKKWEKLPLIECAPGQLNQVFMNLLSNGIQAIIGGGTITIHGRVEANQIVLEFSDTGCGIPPEHHSKLFDPFFTTKPVGEGTGLGLSIAYRIIENHQGTIEVQSEVGHGSVFVVRLPINIQNELSVHKTMLSTKETTI